MDRYHVSIEHRLIGGLDRFTTTAVVEARDASQAIAVVLENGVRQGHELVVVTVFIADKPAEAK